MGWVRPCFSIFSRAKSEAIKEAILKVDPEALFIDGRTSYSYPYDICEVKEMLASEFRDDSYGYNEERNKAAEIVESFDIEQICEYAGDYDGGGLDGISHGVHLIMQDSLARYIVESRPELKDKFPFLDYGYYEEAQAERKENELLAQAD